jgi:hypothetical protein
MTCKLVVKSIFALVNHCSFKSYFSTTIEGNGERSGE